MRRIQDTRHLSSLQSSASVSYWILVYANVLYHIVPHIVRRAYLYLILYTLHTAIAAKIQRTYKHNSLHVSFGASLAPCFTNRATALRRRLFRHLLKQQHSGVGNDDVFIETNKDDKLGKIFLSSCDFIRLRVWVYWNFVVAWISSVRDKSRNLHFGIVRHS